MNNDIVNLISNSNNPFSPTAIDAYRAMTLSELETLKGNLDSGAPDSWDLAILLNDFCIIRLHERDIAKANARIAATVAKHATPAAPPAPEATAAVTFDADAAERAENARLDALDDEREIQDYIDEHGDYPPEPPAKRFTIEVKTFKQVLPKRNDAEPPAPAPKAAKLTAAQAKALDILSKVNSAHIGNENKLQLAAKWSRDKYWGTVSSAALKSLEAKGFAKSVGITNAQITEAGRAYLAALAVQS